MTTGKAAIVRPGELNTKDRVTPATPLVTCEGSTSAIKGVTVLGLCVPIGLQKNNYGDSVMLLDARRSHKSAASTANSFQTMRPRSGQGRRTASSTCSAMQLMRVYSIAQQTPHTPRL